MLTEYIDESLRRARYEIIDDAEPAYGQVKELQGVWATGQTIEQCRDNLKEVVESWILISLKKDLPIPKLGNIEINLIEEIVDFQNFSNKIVAFLKRSASLPNANVSE